MATLVNALWNQSLILNKKSDLLRFRFAQPGF